MTTTTKKVLLKVIILGESGVGKTALLHKYVTDEFIESHKSTIGADFLTKDIEIDDKLITLQMWDTAGQERFKSLGNSFYRGSDAAILVYDITSKDTFDKVDEWKRNFLNLSGENSNEFPILLLGNKHDLSQNRAVAQNDGQGYSADNNMIFFETSAVNGKNIREGIRAIADKAASRNTAPIFSADVISQLNKKDNDNDTDNTPPAASGGCCNLL